ncbi:hypothetical protein FWH13_03750 [Candidatus Saccharibacteria bacterium]|nr:hypothetical protein [Candidatus Saccharibacteria bacterium]
MSVICLFGEKDTELKRIIRYEVIGRAACFILCHAEKKEKIKDFAMMITCAYPRLGSTPAIFEPFAFGNYSQKIARLSRNERADFFTERVMRDGMWKDVDIAPGSDLKEGRLEMRVYIYFDPECEQSPLPDKNWALTEKAAEILLEHLETNQEAILAAESVDWA